MVVRPVPMRDRLVTVEADLGEGHDPRWRYGSGLLIGGRQLLTAAHVVQGARGVAVQPPGRAPMQAVLAGALIGAPDRFDLAVLDVPEADELAALPVAGVNRNVAGGEFVEGCWAVGFPEWQEVERDTAGRSLRESAEVKGEIPPLSGLGEDLLSLQVTASPRALPSAGPLDTSEWSGMSGAAVFAGRFLVGVVTEHSPRRGPSDVTVTPLAALLNAETGPADSVEWRRRLAAPASLPLLPVPPSRPVPAYSATLRVIHHWTPVLVGRDDDLARISAFASGAADAFGPGTGAAGYVWLVGGPWAGKTALLAEAVHSVPAQVDVVAYFLIARDSQASREQFFSAVVPQLAWLLDENVPQAIDMPVFQDLWERAAARAETLGRHLLLVVDGLDEDLRPGGLSVAAALPTERLGKHARVLVASRINYELPGDVVHHPLLSVQPVFLTNSDVSEKLGRLAKQEIEQLLPRDPAASSDLVFDVLGLLTAARGALSISDLATMMNGVKARSIDAFISNKAARSLEAVGPPDAPRYRFAHQTLLEFCQQYPYVGHDPQYRQQLNTWAEQWRAKGWPVRGEAGAAIPGYLLDSYPAALLGDPEHPTTFPPEPDRLADLCADVGWVDTAICTLGVDHVLGTLRTAAAAAPAGRRVFGLLAVVAAQAQNIRPPHPVDQPGYALRQLCIQAMEHGRQDIADVARERLMSLDDPGPVPWWTMVTSQPPVLELGTQDDVGPAAAFPDGRVVTCGYDGRVLLWDVNKPGSPVEIGRHRSWVSGFSAVEALPPRWVVTGGQDGEVLLWDRDRPGADPVVLGHHDDQVTAVKALPDRRLITGDNDGLVRIWDPEQPGTDPVELARWPDGGPMNVWVTADRQVVIAGDRGPLVRWDPEQPGTDPVVLSWRGVPWTVGLLPGDRIVSAEGPGGDVLVRDERKPLTDPIRLGNHGARVGILQVFSGRILTGGEDGWVLEWDPDKPGAGPLVVGHHDAGRYDAQVQAMEMLPDGRIVTTGKDGRVRVWDFDPAVVPPAKFGGHDAWAQAVGYRNDSGSLTEVGGDHWNRPMGVIPGGQIVTGGPDGRVLLWDPDELAADPVEVGRHEKPVDNPIEGAVNSASVKAVGVLPGGVVTAGRDGRLLRWDLTKPGADPVELGSSFPLVSAMRILPDGQILTGELSGRVLRWDPTTPGAEPTQLVPPITSGTVPDPSVIGLLEDGRVVMLYRQAEQVVVWNPKTPKALPLVLSYDASALGVLPSRVIIGKVDGRVIIQDPARPEAQPVELGNHGAKVEAVEVLPDGRVVTAGADETIRMGDPGKPRALKIKVTCPVRGLAITPPTETQNVWLAIAHGRQGLSVWNPHSLTLG